MVTTSYGSIPDCELIVPVFPSVPTHKLKTSNFDSDSTPTRLTPKLAYFIGFFCGDGGLKDIQKTFNKTKRFEYKIIISDEFEIQIKIIQKLFLDLFGIKPPIRYERIAKGERLYYLNPTCKRVYAFLTNVFDFPPGPKAGIVKIPKQVLDSTSLLQKWFARGVFDADGDTRAVEKGFTSQSRVKLRMKSPAFIRGMKGLLEEVFGVSVNGPYQDKEGNSSYIQVERFGDLRKLNKQLFFIHPVKRWRLEKSAQNLISSHKAQCLKQFT